MSEPSWASDVPISMPAPLDAGNVPLIDMGGFAFTINGLFHNLNTSDHEILGLATHIPYGPTNVVYDDEPVDSDSVEFF